nr:hypothetical protein [Streptomyces sp. S1D4-11]
MRELREQQGPAETAAVSDREFLGQHGVDGLGLVLAVTVTGHLDCCCGESPESYWGCRLYADGSAGQPGALHIRFSRRSGDRARHYKHKLNDYEERRNLYRPVSA